jgi:5'-nucleotidase / UDP-sugar diphosphatase
MFAHEESENGKYRSSCPRSLRRKRQSLLLVICLLSILGAFLHGYHWVIPSHFDLWPASKRIEQQAGGNDTKLTLWYTLHDQAGRNGGFSWFEESSRWKGCKAYSEKQVSKCSLRKGGGALATTKIPDRQELSSDGSHAVMLMFTSDVHGHVLQTCRGLSCYPGAASVASVIQTVRSASKIPVLLVDAGDALFGSSDANETIVLNVMNLLGYDAMVLGNHDFDVGHDRLERFAKGAHFPILASNADGANFVQKYLRVELEGHVSLCIIGVSTGEANPLAGEKISMRPEVDVIEYATNLKRDGLCNHTIVVSHGGILVDQKIANKGSAVIDAVIGGHSHVMSGVPSDAAPESAEFGEVMNRPFPFRIEQTDAPIAHVGSYGRYMGLLRLEWIGSKLTAISGSLVPLDTRHGVSPDKDIDRWLSDQSNQLSTKSHHGVHIKIDKTLEKNAGCGFICRKKECTLGNLVTDAMRACVLNGACSSFVPKEAATLKTLALLESGTLRDCLSTNGDEDFGSILPWPNNLFLLTVTGKVLREMLEHGVKSRKEGAGGFLQTSGFRYQYNHSSVLNISVPVDASMRLDKRETHASKRRVTMSQIPTRCSEEAFVSSNLIQNKQRYLIVVTDWLASGGDGYGSLVAKAESSIKTNVLLRDVVLWHTTTSPTVHREGRSCFISAGGSSSSASSALSGMVGGYIAFITAYPLYTLFVRKSASGNEGFTWRGLFDGVFLGSIATASCQFIYFLVYHSASLLQYSPLVRSAVGAVSTVLVTNPQWVVVTRLQTSKGKLSLQQAIQLVYNEKGWTGFFAGVSMNLAMCVFPVVRQVAMESILEFTGLKSPAAIALAASLSACLATVVTLPIQRMRVRLQQGLKCRDVVGWKDCCDGLAFKVLHSCFSSFVLFVVKAHLEDRLVQIMIND